MRMLALQKRAVLSKPRAQRPPAQKNAPRVPLQSARPRTSASRHSSLACRACSLRAGRARARLALPSGALMMIWPRRWQNARSSGSGRRLPQRAPWTPRVRATRPSRPLKQRLSRSSMPKSSLRSVRRRCPTCRAQPGVHARRPSAAGARLPRRARPRQGLNARGAKWTPRARRRSGWPRRLARSASRPSSTRRS